MPQGKKDTGGEQLKQGDMMEEGLHTRYRNSDTVCCQLEQHGKERSSEGWRSVDKKVMCLHRINVTYGPKIP